MSWKKMFEILTLTFLPNHVPGRMPSLSIYIYLDSTHFSELFDISYMLLGYLYLSNSCLVMAFFQFQDQTSKHYLFKNVQTQEGLISVMRSNGPLTPSAPILTMIWEVTMNITKLTALSNFPRMFLCVKGLIVVSVAWK